MKFTEYYDCFTENELAAGAELYFSGDLQEIETTAQKSPTGENAPAEKKFCNHFPDSSTVLLKAKWREQAVHRKETLKSCSLRLHEGLGLVCETSCCCERFQEQLYGCPHVAGLLTAYIVQKEGEDVLRGTGVEELLKNMTNTEDPFLPGVLKRTDGRILSLLEGNENQALPVWREALKQSDPLRISASLEKSSKGILLGLKAGTGRRMYQVQDLREFLELYQNEGIFTSGKAEFKLGRKNAEAQSGELLDYLSGLYSASVKGLLRGQLFAADGNKHYRYILLSGPELDSFLELYGGMVLSIAFYDERLVNLDKKGLSAVLRKKAYGATLRIDPVNVLFVNGTRIYLSDATDIFRVESESTEKTQAFLSLLEWDDELYIRESEIGAVCRNLLPVFRRFGNVITKGMDFEDYEQEFPQFMFQMDYSSEHILTCIPYAVYKKQDFKVPLFDSKTDAGRRNGYAESQVSDALTGYFNRLDSNTFTLYSRLDEEELYEFMKNTLPALEKLGSILVTESLKRNRVRALPSMKVGVSVEGGHILLSLQGNGLTEAETAQILGAYRKKKKYFRLKSGEFLSMEGEGENGQESENVWDTASSLYADYGKKDPNNIRIPAFRAMYLSEMLENKRDTEFEATGQYRELLMAMDTDSEADKEVPAPLREIMRPYQTDGYRWISMLKRCGFGGILADDMGLGKTLQILSFLLSEKLSGKKGDDLRTLVVCPASLVYNWKKEIEKYTPKLSCVVIAGTAAVRKELLSDCGNADILITSYDLLKRDISLYEELCFANQIIDEAQFVKNQKTQAAQSVRLVNSSFRMALTGTPIENYLSELWSIMDYLMPGILFQYGKFQSEYETPIVAGKNTDILNRLRKMVHPFILRRQKKQVLKELPDKLQEVVSVRLEGEQKKLYDASAEEIRLMLDSVSASEFKSGKLMFLAKLTGLRQICCDPSLIYEDYRGGSAKLEACLELISQAIDGGHKLLLFSQFTSMLDIIGERLKDEGIEYHRIDGSVPKEKRMELVDSFAGDNVPVFLISLKAGGTGLNLTAADIVIHYDPWWNQAAQDQATDRTHRIGQTQRVTVYELIAEDTVEERIERIKEGKNKLVEDVLSGDGIGSTSINREEMLSLLG
ncbi:MAG TPA: hypothetical protein DCL38_02650 [Lachnospiraceae bacterium]|nr:hypothetical protein [Lachnospiraceae bacterium]